MEADGSSRSAGSGQTRTNKNKQFSRFRKNKNKQLKRWGAQDTPGGICLYLCILRHRWFRTIEL
jgi:hypothetical protein